MLLSDKHISSFQEIYKQEFGKEISKDDAYEQGAKLIRLVQIVYQPITKEEYGQIQMRRKLLNKK